MDINEELFSHRQAIIDAATEAVLGKDYYNYCCDAWSCTEMCMEDILYKFPFGKKYVKKYREIMAQKNKELDERYKKEMNKYEFHVGDYVETKDGEKGFIENIVNHCDKDNDFIVKFNDGLKIYKIDLICNSVYDSTCNGVYSSTKTYFWINIDKVFNRIGQYDFTKPQKQNKIEPIKSIEVRNDRISDITINDVISRLNQVIDYINSKED